EAPAAPAPPARGGEGHRVGAGAPGGRRRLGRHPAAVGLLAAGAVPGGPRAGLPVLNAGLAGLDRLLVREQTPDGVVRRLEACQSPVWDTGLAVTALLDAGVPADDPGLVRAADWLLGEEIRVRGDWAVRRPGLAPGGWAFEFANDGYPDT